MGGGIRIGSDLKAQTLECLQQHFGKAGTLLLRDCTGIDERPVCADRVRKSIGARTRSLPIFSRSKRRGRQCEPIIEKVWRCCEGKTIRGRTGDPQGQVRGLPAGHA